MDIYTFLRTLSDQSTVADVAIFDDEGGRIVLNAMSTESSRLVAEAIRSAIVAHTINTVQLTEDQS